MRNSTYTARLVGSDSTENVELELIDGLPVKSFARPSGENGEDVIWELVQGSDDYEYRQGGRPGADYS